MVLIPVATITSMQAQKGCVEGVVEAIATEAEKMAAPLCKKLKKENTLITLNLLSDNNLAEKMPSENNLQNKIFLNLWLMMVANIFTNTVATL